jgi:hypothetical protein
MQETQPLPPPPPPDILIPFDTMKPDATGTYVNVLMQYVHEVGIGERPGGQVVTIGSRMLVLLDHAVRGWCLSTGATVHFRAAILKVEINGQIEGWLVREQEDAKRVFYEIIDEEKS